MELIIADIDGCLSPESSVAWDMEHFMEFVRLARAANAGEGPLPPMTLCTGRPQPYAEVLMKQLDIRVPAICENGAVIYTLEDNHARFGPGVTHEKIQGLRELRAMIETDLLPRYPQAVLQFGKEAQMSVFSKQPEIFPAMHAQIEDWLARHGGPALVINPSHFYLNISLAGVDKGAAIREVLGLLKLDKIRTAGIGDTVGDIPIRDNVGWFACPANAHEPVKQVADYVAPHEMVHGVLDILAQPWLKRGAALG